MTTAETEIRTKTKELQTALATLGKRLDDGDDSEILVWVISAVLACAHRPLRHHPEFGRDRRGRNLPPKATPKVFEWLRRIKDSGIRSIICLMHSKELGHYSQLDLGAENLIEFYKTSGLEVRHVEWDDPAHRPSLDRATYARELLRIRTQALRAFDELPKPVLLHCSAGIDRSSPVAAYVFHMRTSADDA